MEPLPPREPRVREPAPLSTFEPVKTSARSNREVDAEEMEAGFPVIAVFFVVAMAFALVSIRAGMIAAGLGITLLLIRHFHEFRK